ncbi:hypothetical protein RN001_010455 [Aquatica leii]|uniref:G-patch domain-containing protein n=1 Tax=Aquatica leii TaxID=1421715 RepID=A0AAN7SG11_9COLE|nr:hypothetical protein RN001_010455 [Aquatica leii]
MSMLAEKRRKQKWSLNPQGKHWLTDSNKFGLKILESMGWKEGKGLGKQQDGITEPIRIAFKNDNKGLGLKENPSSMQQDHFNALLESLNTNNDSQTKTITSLEEKSQKSRTRVHYKKFTRGKDLSKYSAKDLANIFEKKSLKIEAPEPVANNTVNKGSMIDYFSNKMPNGLKLEQTKSYSESDDDQCFGFGFTNPAFDPLKPTFTVTTKHSLNTIVEEPEVLNETITIKETEVKKRKKNKSCVDEVEYRNKEVKVKKRKTGIDNPALNNSIKQCDIKIKKQKKGIDNPALEINPSPEQKPKKRKKTKCGIDNPSLDLDLVEEQQIPCDFMMNVVEEPIPVPKQKISKKKGCDNYGFDAKVQRIEENIGYISRSIETYQAEVENDINEIKDEDMYVGEFSGCDGENQKQKDGVLLRFKYASFTKDPHWTVKYNQTVNLAKKSYKHLIKGDIAVGFKESNLHEIKGYGYKI